VSLALMTWCACIAIDLAEYAGWPLALARAGLLVAGAIALAPVLATTRLLAPAAIVAAGVGASFHWYEASGSVASLDRIILASAWSFMPVLLAFARNAAVERMLAALSAFAVIVGTSSTVSFTLPVVAFFVAAATWWLAMRLGSAPSSRTLALVASALVVMATLTAGMVSHSPIARWSAGVVPASGGIDRGSASARGGIGDGPDEVSGDNATSAGFDQHDRFSESALDGLYDMWVESFGEPVKSDRTQRMVNLKPEEARVIGAVDRQDLRSGKRFDLQRATPGKAQAKDAPQPDALLMVQGRTPLHLRLATFEIFDGAAWHAGSDINAASSIRIQPNDTWFSLIDHPDCGGFAQREVWRIRFTAPGGSILPMPPAIRRFELGRVRDASFFRERNGSLIGVDRATVPAGTVLAVDAHTFDLAGLVDRELSADLHRLGRLDELSALDPDTRRVVESWIHGLAPGWAQIEAVVARVREAASFDRSATVVDADPTRALVVEGRAGASYHFASAAAEALRSLGYRTRLVAGFYVPPGRAEQDSGQTPVSADDSHVWVEVRLATGAWMPLEATPGFELIGPKQGPWSWLTGRAGALIRWAQAHVASTAGTVAAVAIVMLARRRLAEWSDRLGWWLRTTMRPDQTLPATVRLLERRARRWGHARPGDVSVRRWLEGLTGEELRETCERLASLHDRRMFARTDEGDRDDQATCRQACVRLGPTVFRRAGRTGASG
jgi:transglutaminase-like putative cysteine protease